jgi:hypothetical protein
MISSVTKPCYDKRKNMWDNRVNIQRINEIPIYVQPKVNIAKNEQYNEEQLLKNLLVLKINQGLHRQISCVMELNSENQLGQNERR